MSGILSKGKRLEKLPDSVLAEYGLAVSNNPVAVKKQHRETKRPVQYQSLMDALQACDIRSGATVSFHHHFRNGDRVVAAVMDCLARLGVDNLTIAASSIFPCHASLVPHIESGVITKIYTDYMAGPVADAVICGKLRQEVVFQSHGGRARAISTGQLPIDIAVIGAGLANTQGDTTGRGGQMPCGPLGYAMVDAEFAGSTLILADQIVEGDLANTDIPGSQVDGLVHFPEPGSPGGISFGSTKPLETPEAHKIGKAVADIVSQSGILKPGFSFQTGAGGYSLSCVPPLGNLLRQRGIQAEFLAGGITGAHVEILEAGYAKEIRDVQCFDQAAVRSSIENDAHHCMSASQYASPAHPNPSTAELSLMVLGAAEVDADFNVNVLLGGDGSIIGGPGGHPDTAAGADITIVTTRLNGGGYAKLVDRVSCVCTPGKNVDVVVTDNGIAVNPNNERLAEILSRSEIETRPIQQLIEDSAAASTKSRTINDCDPVAIVEAPGGDIMDVILGR